VGLLLAIAASGSLLLLFPETCAVVAYLRVKSPPPPMDSLDQQQRLTPKDFEIFQQTQLTLLKSDLVLKEVLARPEISQLDTVIKKEPNASQWLYKNLRVSFPGEGEIMEVRYDGNESPADMQKIIESVIYAYSKEALHHEADPALQRIQVMQPATASDNINTGQRYFIASAGGLATLCLTCFGGVLIGCCASKPERHANEEPH